jgi:phage-related protein
VATSVGQINFGVSIDASGIAAELNAQLAPALTTVQNKLNAKPLQVKLDIDTRTALRAMQRELNLVRVDDIEVHVDIDTRSAIRRAQREMALVRFDDITVQAKIDTNVSEDDIARLKALAPVLRSLAKISDQTIDFRLNTHVSQEDIDRLKAVAPVMRSLSKISDQTLEFRLNAHVSQADIDRLKALGPALRSLRTATDKDITIRVNVAMSEAEVQRLRDLTPALRTLRGLADRNVTIRIDLQVDEAALARVALLLRELRSRQINVNVNSDDADRASRNVDNLSRSLRRTSLAIGLLGAGGAIFAAIGGAAGGAAGAVGGLAAAVAALGPAVAAIGATAIVGFKGIGDAFSAMSDIGANAAADAKTQNAAIAAAQDQVTAASDAAEAAQLNLAEAHEAVADAAKGVADAYKTAQERLDGYVLSLREANLDEKEARLNLAEAQKKLREGKFTDPLDRQRAILAVQRAQLNLAKSQDANRKLQEEANEAQQKGIDQSKEVVAARKQEEKATRDVAKAEKESVRASEAVAKAAAKLAEAQTSAGSSSDKFAEALAKLSPNAQEFVLAFRALQPTLEATRKAVQDVLFADLGHELTETARVALPALTEGMKGVAGELNGIIKGFFEFSRSATGIQAIQDTFAGAQKFLQGAREGAEGFGQALADVASTALPHLEGIGQAFGNIGTEIAKAFSGAAGNGVLDQVFVGLEGTLRGVGDLLGTVTAKLLDIAAQVLPALGPLLTALADVISDIAPSLGDLGKTFAESLTLMMPVLGAFLNELLKGLKPVLPVLAMLFNSLASALVPLIDPLSQVLVTLGTTLADVLDQLAPAIGPLAQAFADLFKAVAPILPLLAESLSTLIQALAPALSEVFKALGPVVQIFADEMRPVIQELAPVLAETAKIIGVALADALRQIAPVLPDLIASWSDLLVAIAPLLPELARMTAEILPPLIDVLVRVSPIVVDMIDTFTWFVEQTLPVIQTAIQGFAAFWADQFSAMGDVVGWLADTAFPALDKALVTVQGWFSTAVEAIGKKWDELRDKAAVPINYVIGTVWNNGLLKAWGSIDNLLGGILPDAVALPLIPTRATGGPLHYRGSGGSGNGTKDDILFWGSNNEHVITAAEVLKAGGQNIIYAIRDMIARGIPFTWDNGKLITDLGRDNLNRYGAAVRAQGIGNVPPEGLFDQLARVPIPQFGTGGIIMPWMNQLKAGHDFARAQDGKAYQWAGPRFVGDSFDCSGFMGSIIAAILGSNPWQRYWSTASFAGYPSVGVQGLVKNLTEGSGMAVGITNDPGGPGGGHTAGELRGIPELGIPAARVESGGAIGNVHYGRGTDPNSFASLYGLPIGANGFFAPAPGGSSNGPSVTEQSSFITKVVESAITAATDPVRETLRRGEWVPPPQIRAVPLAALDTTAHFFAEAAGKAVGGLGSLVGGIWQRARNLGGSVVDAGRGLLGHLTPFDTGGIATGTGFMAKDTIEPERILSPEQTALFEALVQALTKIAATGLSAAAQAAQTVTVDLSKASVDALRLSTGVDKREVDQTAIDTKFMEIVSHIDMSQRDTFQLISDTAAETQRTQTSLDEAAQAVADEQTKQLLDIANRLSIDVLGPILSAAVGAGTDFINGLIDGLGKDVVNAVNGTTRAVNNLSETVVEDDTGISTPAFGEPGSAFDAVSAVSDAVVSVANAATQAFNKVRDDVVQAALRQTRSEAGESRGLLGRDISGGFLVDLIVQLTGVEIEVRDLLENTLDQITAFREGAFSGFNESGQLISDTAAIIQRNQSSIELAAKEQERIQKALIKAVIKYLILNILLPIITAILGAMIVLASTAIGAAIGSAIPIIGTAIGAAVGAAIGAALSGLAAVFVGVLAVGAGAALDAFDEGGVAQGTGYMPKNTIAPERVLSPRQTSAFETLVQVLDRGDRGNRTTQIGSVNIHGRDPAGQTADRLLSLLNT